MSLLPFMFDKSHLFHRSELDRWLNECPAFRSFRSELPELSGIEQEAKIGKDGFRVCLDVHHFQPNEISVITENHTVVVQAKHEEKRDEHGYISREFTRKYSLPEGFKVDEVTSSLSSDGILSIKAPHEPPAVGANIRHIQIQQTGPARLNISKSEEKRDSDEKDEDKK